MTYSAVSLTTRTRKMNPAARKGYTAFMRLLGYALILGAFIATLAANASSAALNTQPDLHRSPSVPERILEAHHCWSGEAPADMRGQIPGHAVVELNTNRGPEYVDSSIGFAIWQGQRSGHLYGFCR